MDDTLLERLYLAFRYTRHSHPINTEWQLCRCLGRCHQPFRLPSKCDEVAPLPPPFLPRETPITLIACA